MGDAWGGAWGDAWGGAWGAVDVAAPGPIVGGARRRVEFPGPIAAIDEDDIMLLICVSIAAGAGLLQ